MIEIKGKYSEAKIFVDVVDSASIAQVQELCNQEFTAGSHIRLVSDIHVGVGCTIDTTMTIVDKVMPNLASMGVGCGMETTCIREGRLELQKLDKLVYEKIPSGFSIRDKARRYLNEIDLSELCRACHADPLRAKKSIDTPGGGDHFIEADKDDEGNLYIAVHSGSRHLGVEAASYYQEVGYKVLNHTDDASIEALITRMKTEGRERKIQKELKKLKNLRQTNVPKTLAYTSGELSEQYIHDMKIVQHFAMLNRQTMMDEIVKGTKLHVEGQFTITRNYTDTGAMTLWKGAVSAKEGERLLIPINMRDGSLLCVGKGNEDWDCSAPYGAGRLMSRVDVKQSLTVSELKRQMAEVYTTSVSKATLDERSTVYKGMRDILDSIGPTVDVVKVIRPTCNFKARNEEQEMEQNTMTRDGIAFKDEDGQAIFNQHSFCRLVKHLLVELVGISHEEASQIVDCSPLAEPVTDVMGVMMSSHDLPYYWVMLFYYGNGYWQKGIPVQPEGMDAYETLENKIMEKHDLKEPFIWA